MTFPRPEGKPAFTAPWFKWFASQLTLPNGRPFVLEGHLLLIVDEVFATGRVELLVCLPKGQGKTALMASLAVWHLLTVENANCFIGAADKIQADEMYRFACHYVESEPEIEARLLVRRSTREIRSLRDQGFLRILASDDSKTGGKRQGFNPTLALLDELHAHENDSLYIDMRTGLFKNKGILVTITTAGHDLESVLGRLRAKFLNIRAEGGTLRAGLVVNGEGNPGQHPDGRLTIARSKTGRTAMLEWACREDDDISDPAVVKLAHPASWVTLEALEDAREAPGITPWAYERYFANRWTLGFDSWIPAGSWDALAEPGLELEEGAPTVAALDMARYRDCAALVAIQNREDAPRAVQAWIWRPGGQDDPVPYSVVMDRVRWLHERYDLRAGGFDPRWFDQAAEELDAEGIAMEAFPQSNERMTVAAAELRQDILEGNLAFNPEHEHADELAAHVMGAVAKDVGANAFKLDKARKNGPDIDAAEALAMANWLAKVAEPGSSYDDPDMIV